MLLEKIDAAIAASERDLAALTIKLVNIKSLMSDPIPGGPFGEGCKKVLDTFLEMSEQAGFYCTDYKVGVASASLKEGQPDVGIWLHGDVVPEGDDWLYEPYNATELDGCIIGRGATDNKGQLAAMFLLLKIFKDLGVELKYNPAVYVGSNEEFGMTDLIGDPNIPEAKGFLNVATPPRLSLVPDSSFPVGYGGKGGMNITIKSKTPLHGFTMWAGREDSPGRATAILEDLEVPAQLPDCTIESKQITAECPPIHAAHPKPGGNMITKLCGALEAVVRPEDRHIMEFFKMVSLCIDGEALGIKTVSQKMGDLTTYAKAVTMVDGCPAITVNIRFPIEITYDEIVENVGKVAEKWGFEVHRAPRGNDPYLLDPNTEVVQTLCKIANEQTGNDKAPYTLSGGTYAHRLPNAYPYGAAGSRKPACFPEGRGGAHGKDESVGLDRLQRAMRIYARALLALNELDF